jgi:hypothetical protein
MADSGDDPRQELTCEECSCITEAAEGWVSLIVDDPDEPDFEEYVVFYCPVCAEREFNYVPCRGLPYT